jgi:phosphonate utilization transcriptional regulator
MASSVSVPQKTQRATESAPQPAPRGARVPVAEPDPPTALALLRSSSLASAAQQEIERAILRGELAPGAKLNEAAIAERLGVSRGPVREAFRMLEQAGLLRQEKNRGAFVRHIDIGEAMEIYELRAMMDEAIGRKLAREITPEQLKAARSIVTAMERAVKAGDTDAYHLLNLEFHDTLVAFTANRKLTAMYRLLINQLWLFRRLNLADARVLPVSASEHIGIVKAIESGDPERAARAMREHVEQSRERTLHNHPSTAIAADVTPRKLHHA